MSEGQHIPIAGGDTAERINLAKRVELIEHVQVLEHSKVLDLGCGEGDYVEALASRGALAQGIEFQASKVERHKAKYPGSDRVTQGDITALPFKDGSYDLVLMNEVLEHVPDETASLREARRVLRPGGVLVIFAPNRLFPFETHGVHLTSSDRRISHATPFIPYIPVPLGRHIFRYWARNYWPWELRRKVREANFTILATPYVWQTFEGISSHQPSVIRATRHLLRRVADFLEGTPVLKSFGSSQVIVAKSPRENDQGP